MSKKDLEEIVEKLKNKKLLVNGEFIFKKENSS